jgi:hypothetical protein
MRCFPLLIALAGLVLVAGATAKLTPQTKQPSLCYDDMCAGAMNTCVEKCGLGPHCKSYCECKLFSDPKVLCRVAGEY